MYDGTQAQGTPSVLYKGLVFKNIHSLSYMAFEDSHSSGKIKFYEKSCKNLFFLLRNRMNSLDYGIICLDKPLGL